MVLVSSRHFIQYRFEQVTSSSSTGRAPAQRVHHLHCIRPTEKTDNSRFLPFTILSKYTAVTFSPHFGQEPEQFNSLATQSRHMWCSQEVVMVLVSSEHLTQYREVVVGLAQRQMMSRSAQVSHSIIQNFELCILVTESSGKRAP